MKCKDFQLISHNGCFCQISQKSLGRFMAMIIIFKSRTLILAAIMQMHIFKSIHLFVFNVLMYISSVLKTHQTYAELIMLFHVCPLQCREVTLLNTYIYTYICFKSMTLQSNNSCMIGIKSLAYSL